MVAGDFKEGVLFWAANRSLKVLPSCLKKNASEWQRGCLAAKDWFAPIDKRRHTEANYWWGWNSI
jgi:hypothetical protein